ncbi:hypothetical protein M422DRAFT_155365 [Sphaerobolus stellatus SS14]|nr:hypothetical protein M422DRAFT_155365 [Sphaerobolus stellatus SS14]
MLPQQDSQSSSLQPDYLTIDVPSPGSSVFDIPIHVGQSVSRRRINEKRINQVFDDGLTSFIVVSGGTGCNSLCSAFGTNTCYVLPVSDDGGSSSEIIRVIGGPSVGDIRSRLIRLIPPTPPDSPLTAIRDLLSHRLSGDTSEEQARDEWRNIVEGKSPLWHGIPADRKEAIRGTFLVHFETEILRRAHKNFSFRNGSIGNYLLAAAQDFFRSLPSAIFLFSSITTSQAHILPVLVTTRTVTIAVELEDNSTIIGQCNISHPVTPPSAILSPPDADALDGDRLVQFQNAAFQKQSEAEENYVPLSSRISRLFYINPYGHQVQPSPNPEFLSNLSSRDILIYSCGSLWTSIMPCLAIRGVGESIAKSPSLRAKVLLLNSVNDRETDGYTAIDYISAIVETLRTRYSPRPNPLIPALSGDYPATAFITHLLYLEGSDVEVDVQAIQSMGIICISVKDQACPAGQIPKFGAETIRQALEDILEEIALDV